MPQWNQPGQPEQPGQPPPQPPPREKSNLKKALGFGCLALIALVVLIVIVVVATSGEDEDGGPAPEKTSEPPKEESPTASPRNTAKSYGDGDYTVGRDIPAGTYESAGAKDDVVEACSITTEPKGDKLPQLKTAERNERIIITLSAGDGTVTVQGCEPLRRR
jgi:hypothetical protein